MLETCVRIGPELSTLSQAEEENGQSRIYLGIHWAFDKTLESLRPSGSELRIRARVHRAALTESQRDPKKVRRGEEGFEAAR